MSPRHAPVVSVLCLLGAVPAVCGQAPASAPALNTVPFVDKAIGYQMQLPNGWVYDRAAFFGAGGSQGLLRGASPDGRQMLQILLFREIKAKTLHEWLEYFGRQLGGVSGVEQVRIKYQEEFLETGGRPFGYVQVTARDGADHISTLYYCVRFDVSTIWVFAENTMLGKSLEAAAPASQPDTSFEIPAAFQQLVGSLKVFYDARIAGDLQAALQRGKEYVERFKLREAIRALRIDENERWYEISLGGKVIGYMTRKFTRERRSIDQTKAADRGREGLRVSETSWRFGDDGAAFQSVVELFSSLDGASDLFELTDSRVPPESAANPQPITTRDQCLREGDVLFSSARTSADVVLPDPRRPIRLEPTYVGLAWARLLPALLGRDPQPMYAFSIYDAETRALTTFAVQAMGEHDLPGTREKALLYETREGMIEKPTLVYTDARGHLLRVEAGELIVQLSSQKAMEKQFAARRDAAIARLPKGR